LTDEPTYESESTAACPVSEAGLLTLHRRSAAGPDTCRRRPPPRGRSRVVADSSSRGSPSVSPSVRETMRSARRPPPIYPHLCRTAPRQLSSSLYRCLMNGAPAGLRAARLRGIGFVPSDGRHFATERDEAI